MDHSYKLVLLSAHSYREAELTPETEDGFRIGTGASCAMRYRREFFFDEFYLEFTRGASGWQLRCSENIHVTQDGVLKLQSLALSHGMSFSVYSSSDMELFRCSFLLDFERLPRNYARAVDISGLDRISIGGRGEHIQIHDELVGEDTITLVRDGDVLILADNGTRYGVSFNGALIDRPTQVREHDFFSLAGYSFCLRGGKLLTDDLPACTVKLPYTDCPESANTYVYPQFNRSVRLQRQVPEEEVEILPPSNKKEHKKRSFLFSLIPALCMLAVLIILRGIIGGGGIFVIYSVCSMGISILVSIATYFDDRKTAREEERKRQEEYRRYLEGKRSRIEDLRARERAELTYLYPDLEADLQLIRDFDVRLFERAREDPDFLRCYVGRGRIEAPNPVKVTPQEFYKEDDDLAPLPEQMAEEYRYLDDAPITANLLEDNCLGVVGAEEAGARLLWNLSLDIAARHFYKEVCLFYLLGDREAKRFSALRWLPHATDGKTGSRYFGCNEESRGALLETLYAILSERESRLSSEERGEGAPLPWLVVFLCGVKALSQHPISRYFEQAARLGCTFLFFTAHRELLPRGCGEVLFLDSEGEGGDLTLTRSAAHTLRLVCPGPAREERLAAVMKLAAVQTEEITLESELTQNITLFELLGIMTAEDLDLGARWKEAQVFRSMAAPIGVDRRNEIVYLDTGDGSGAHGPHGLVAGTTGSGKSELLQTYILSMASLYHPYDVGFLLIDFKGGGMANQFRALPHLLSSITNIDGREIDRSLRSIKAELVRRQEIFAAAGVNHINDYIKRCKKGEVSTPLPHLIIIVDEFAELKSEFPDFMKELISAARIGRTLGVHLILATQKPSGVVDAQIWANSRFRLCLKVQTKEDSNEVLKSPLASEIKEPGRAYFQVGNNEIFELFQSAYGGAPVPDVETAGSRTYEISAVTPWGKRELVYSNRISGQHREAVSQLQAMVDRIGRYCAQEHIQRLPGICLPPLPDTLELSDLVQPAPAAAVRVSVGWLDDPDQQRQEPLVLDLTGANTFVVGSSQMGKTTLLRTVAAALIQSYSPQAVNLYLIDCGNMALKPLEQARHVGGVVLGTEEERMENLFKLLFRLTGERRSRLAEAGVGTFADYLEGGFRDLPQIVVLLDNVAAFREYYDKLVDQLLVLTREGLSVGISFVVTASQGNALSYKALANFSRRVVFTCTDGGEYSNLLGRGSMTPKPIPGRGLTLQNKQVLEGQIALTGASLREVDRAEAIRALVEARNGECQGAALPIPEVPETLLLDRVFREEPALFRTPGRLPVGLDYDRVEYVSLDLFRPGTLVLTGGDNEGRVGFVRCLLEMLQRTVFLQPVEVYVFDGGARALAPAAAYGIVAQYVTDPSESVAYLEELLERLERADPDDPRLVAVLESRGLLQAIASDKKVGQLALQVMRQMEERGGLFLVSNMENTAPAFSSPELFKQLRDQRQGLVFSNLSECRFFEVNMKQNREFARGLNDGDAYLFQGGRLLRIKTIQAQAGEQGR